MPEAVPYLYFTDTSYVALFYFLFSRLQVPLFSALNAVFCGNIIFFLKRASEQNRERMGNPEEV